MSTLGNEELEVSFSLTRTVPLLRAHEPPLEPEQDDERRCYRHRRVQAPAWLGGTAQFALSHLPSPLFANAFPSVLFPEYACTRLPSGSFYLETMP